MITDLTTLLAAVKRWARRDNLEDDAYLEFIQMAEVHLNSRLRVRRMTKWFDSETIAGVFFYSQPEDASGLRNIEIHSGKQRFPLEFYSPEAMDADFGWSSQGGRPVAYTLSGNGFELQPCPNAAYPIRIIYYQRIPSLTAANPTNWLLSAYPDTYLYGSLMALAEYVRDDEVAGLWAPKFAQALERIIAADSEDRWSGSTPAMKAL